MLSQSFEAQPVPSASRPGPPKPRAQTANDHQQPTLTTQQLRRRPRKKLISLCQGKEEKALQKEKKIKEQVRGKMKEKQEEQENSSILSKSQQ